MRALCAHGFCIMNKKTILLLAMLCGLLASCFKDDEVTLDNYCYIKNVSLGNIKRWNWTTDSLGKPVRYQTTYTGSRVAGLHQQGQYGPAQAGAPHGGGQ